MTTPNTSIASSNYSEIARSFSNALRQNREVYDNAGAEILQQFNQDHQRLLTELPLINPAVSINFRNNITSQQHIDQANAYELKLNILKDMRTEKLANVERVFKETQNALTAQMTELKQSMAASRATTTTTTTTQVAPSSVDIQTSQHPITYITVKFDAGYGNFLSICGTGPNMSWDSTKALPLRCVGDDLWVFETTQTFEQFEYNILMNNKTWEKGASNHSIQRDTPVQITPRF